MVSHHIHYAYLIRDSNQVNKPGGIQQKLETVYTPINEYESFINAPRPAQITDVIASDEEKWVFNPSSFESRRNCFTDCELNERKSPKVTKRLKGDFGPNDLSPPVFRLLQQVCASSTGHAGEVRLKGPSVHPMEWKSFAINLVRNTSFCTSEIKR
ncbi:hypothetical protein CDAR_184391 [Caerostris darwini]|uniref:Uncharacterized protein n=1 Tax=Caerostris darwini TaxID=1538125 RepID=A0AAV4UG21_9ARAC|nr:hypothetical protein CDAR_184391 [Caerostris darwini]